MTVWSSLDSWRGFLFTLGSLLCVLGCDLDLWLDDSNGIRQYEELNLVKVPGGVVNAAGGYLILSRTDLSMDTIVGSGEIRATYNAVSGQWLWNFQVSYDGLTFVDDTGAEHDVSSLADGDPIPGTKWKKVDASRVQTKGGLAYSFGIYGRLSHVAWATMTYPRLRYTWSAASLDIDQCTASVACTPVYSVALDASGNPNVVTDARTGRSAEYDYDGQGRLIAARDGLAVQEGLPGFRYEYRGQENLLSAVTNAEGERAEYTYMVRRRRILTVTSIGEGNPTHTFEHVPRNGELLYPVTHTNPLGGQTRYLFDIQRRLREKELVATGEKTLYTWQGLRPASRTEPAGVTTFTTYVDDELASATLPSGNVVTYTTEPAGLNTDDPAAPAIRRIADSLGTVEERDYDALGRVEKIRNGEGDSVSFTYHSGSTVASAVDPFGVSRSFPFYGIHGHWLEVAGPTPDKRSFDPLGNTLIASKVREVGGILARSWDANRQLASLQMGATDELQQVTTQSPIVTQRRSDGSLTRVARPGGGDHEFSYDALGRLALRRELVNGVWRATTGEVDAAGNLTARELSNGMQTLHTYDAYGRLTRRQTLRDGVVEGVADYTWTDGRVVSYTDSIRGTTELYSYDAAGRLLATLYGYGEVLTREYDLRSRLSGEIYTVPGAGVVADLGYAYDLADRRVQMSDRRTSEALVAHTYQDGKIVRIDTANGLSRDLTYDFTSGRLDGFTTRDALFQVVEETEIAVTAQVGPPRQQIRTVTTTPLATTEEQYWLGLGDGGLQDPDAVVGKRVFGWNDGGSASETFAYDELGNRVSDASGNTFTYNAQRNRLLSASLAATGQTHTYSYDEAGFVTSRDGVPITWTATERMASHGTDTFVCDLQDRLVSMTLGGVSVEQGWFGGRVGGDPVAETLGSLDLGEVSIHLASGARLYRHLDFRQNVRFTSDDAGQVVSHTQYTPYGVDSVYGSTADGVSFVGRQEIGGLMVLGARIYDPAVGRFLSPDPVFQYSNQYVYTMGNPVWFIDSDGRESTSMSPGMNAAVETGKFAGASLLLAASPAGGPAGVAGAGILFGTQGFETAWAVAAWLGTCGLGAEQALPALILWWYIRKRRQLTGWSA